MKNKGMVKRIISLLLVIAMVAVFVPSNVNAASKKNGWVTKKGYKYYVMAGRTQTGFVTIKKKTYYFAPKKMTAKYNDKKFVVAPKGAMLKGWYKIKKNYYYFDRINGKMAKSTTVDGIKINKKGIAKKTSYNIKKINVMILAREVMMSITKPGDAKDVKREKCYDFVMDEFVKTSTTDSSGIIHFETEHESRDWDLKFASFGLENRMGDCVSWAASVAYLLQECGYKDVYIVTDSKKTTYSNSGMAHAWAQAAGRVYDAYFGSYKGKDANYDAGYACDKTGSYQDWPIYMKNISTGEVSDWEY